VTSALELRTCADIAPVTVEWLWEPYLARGRLAVLDGEHGSGKSLVAADLVARLSRGGPLPNGATRAPPATTLLLCAEDDRAATVRPRLAAAGADLARVLVPWGPDGPPQLPGCVPELKRHIQESGARLLVLDPLGAFVPPELATSDRGIKQALAPLATAAAETDCAALLVRSPDRNTGPGGAYRGAGSAGAMSLALTGMLIGSHPEALGVSVLALTKAHLAQQPPALGFEFRADAPTVPDWTGVVDLRADELCAARSRRLVRGPIDRATEFLSRLLRDGPCLVAQIQERATRKGLAWRTVERAKRMMKIRAARAPRNTGWVWRLTEGDAAPTDSGVGTGESNSVYGPVAHLIRTNPEDRDFPASVGATSPGERVPQQGTKR
jgi:putative DNA primase/helicase